MFIMLVCRPGAQTVSVRVMPRYLCVIARGEANNTCKSLNHVISHWLHVKHIYFISGSRLLEKVAVLLANDKIQRHFKNVERSPEHSSINSNSENINFDFNITTTYKFRYI